ncbi:MAG TPA: hypothetical protein VHE54_19830 [Puia sp.]|nr:hypothetical protein [Puia sp.]
MKRLIAAFVLIVISCSLLTSCDRSVTPEQAASHHYKSCRSMR